MYARQVDYLEKKIEIIEKQNNLISFWGEAIANNYWRYYKLQEISKNYAREKIDKTSYWHIKRKKINIITQTCAFATSNEINKIKNSKYCFNAQICEIRTLEGFCDNCNVCASSIECETIAISNFTLLCVVFAQTVS